MLAIDRVLGRTRPMHAVVRSGITKQLDALAGAIIPGEPELPGVAVAKDPPALANLYVPMARNFRSENRIAGPWLPVHKLRWKIFGRKIRSSEPGRPRPRSGRRLTLCKAHTREHKGRDRKRSHIHRNMQAPS